MREEILTVTDGEILDIVRAHVPHVGEGRSLSTTTDLWQAGMDSMSSVAVMVAVEEEYGVELPQELLTREVFASVVSIAAAVRKAMGVEDARSGP